MLRDLGRKIEQEDAQAAAKDRANGASAGEEPAPMPVEIHRPAPTSMQIISTILGPLVSPLATAGIVIVFVIFMLLKREDLRDRLIRLAGSRGLPRTTQALDDAAQRVGRYLLMQLVVNTTYAVPIGIGLWLIGIPNPILWGLLCGLMRFVPYIGPIVAAFFPLALAIAVDPGWTTLLLTGALFIVVELISNNFDGAVALRREHRAVADRHHRRGGLLDLALGTDRPAAFDAAHGLPRRARSSRAAARLPRRAARRRAGAVAARASLSPAARRRSERGDGAGGGISARPIRSAAFYDDVAVPALGLPRRTAPSCTSPRSSACASPTARSS